MTSISAIFVYFIIGLMLAIVITTTFMANINSIEIGLTIRHFNIFFNVLDFYVVIY